MQDFNIVRSLGKGLFGNVVLAKVEQINKQFSDVLTNRNGNVINVENKECNPKKVNKIAASKAEKLVALKVIEKKMIEKDNLFDNVKKEIEIHSKLRHKNILRLYSYFHDSDNVVLVLEYANNGNLREFIMKKQLIHDNLVGSIILQLCRAVRYCHEASFMHRDIKPENILLVLDEKSNELIVKLSDFGWCTNISSHDGTKLKRKTMCGTIYYLAPEMIEECEYDERIDIWTIGIVLFELVVGDLPFKGKTSWETYELISQCNINSLLAKNRNKKYTPTFDILIRGFLAKAPEKRLPLNDAIEEISSMAFLKPIVV